jgi:hypothetical protein
LYQNDRNRVNFPHNQIPLNLELQKEINYHFSEIGGVKFRFIQNRGGKTAFKPKKINRRGGNIHVYIGVL